MIVSDQKKDHSSTETSEIKEDLGIQCQAQHWLKYLCNLVQQWPAQTQLILAQLSPSLSSSITNAQAYQDSSYQISYLKQ